MNRLLILATGVALLAPQNGAAKEPLLLWAHGRPEDLQRLEEDVQGIRLLPVSLRSLRNCEFTLDGPAPSGCYELQAVRDPSGEHSVSIRSVHGGKTVVLAHGSDEDLDRLESLLPQVELLRTREAWCGAGGHCVEAWLPEETDPDRCFWKREGRVVLLSQDLPLSLVGDLCVSHGVSVLGTAPLHQRPPLVRDLPAEGGPMGGPGRPVPGSEVVTPPRR